MGGKSKALNDALNDVCVECPEQSAQVASNIQAAQDYCCRVRKMETTVTNSKPCVCACQTLKTSV